MDYDKNLNMYDDIVKISGFIRKGKTMPYTSDFGHMFSLVNKAGEIGFRYSKNTQLDYFDKYETSYFISYGAKMKGYILIPQWVIEDKEVAVRLLKESYEYISTLDPK